MYLWPFRLLPPLAARWTRPGASLLGGQAIDGASQQASRTDGGGLWRLDCSFVAMSVEAVLALRAWDAYLDAGTVEFLMPVLDLHFAPRPIVAGSPAKPGRPPLAADPFAEEANYGSVMMSATNIGMAALRATSMVINMAQGAKVQAGHIFSVNHGTAGWRKYNISQVTSSSGNQFTCSFRPPLREAVANGAAIEFDVPRCVMRLHPEAAQSLSQSIDLLKVGDRVSASFIESFGAP